MVRIRSLPQTLYSKFFFSPNRMSPETVKWGYRLFLDREPESSSVVAVKNATCANTRELRQALMCSDEFKQHNVRVESLSLSGDEGPMFIQKVSDLDELFFHIQKVWEHLGETDPYWSVLTCEKYTSSRIKDTRTEFYNSGLNNVVTLFKTLERNGIDHTSFKTCLEYGCGLGRVTGWLARRFERVIGFDISKSHLQIAGRYLDEIGVRNTSLHQISKPQEIGDFPKVDVVYSAIVLQHNPPPLIGLIIQELIRALNPGGIAYFQVPTYRLGYRFSLQEYLAREVARGEMEMHVFPQNEIFDIVSKEQGKLVEILEDGWTGLKNGERSNTFVIQKE